MTDDQIHNLAKFQADIECEKLDYSELYHYTTNEVAEKILLNDGLCLRMTLAEDFDDEHEGRKTIEVFYDLALEKLLRDSIITQSAFEQMSRIEVPCTTLSVYYDHELKAFRGRAKEYDAYVLCFSTQKDDPFMIENYIKNEDHRGYCLSFYTDDLRENETTTLLFDKGSKFHLSQVLYGEEIVNRLYNYMKRLVTIPDNCDEEFLTKWGCPLIREQLSRMRYSVKRYRYSLEKEVRLIFLVPKEPNTISMVEDSGKTQFVTSPDNQKHYVDVSFPQYVFSGLSKTMAVTDEEERLMRKRLQEMRYKV